jgi:hypothetical protein
MWASHNGHGAAVQALLAGGADPALPNACGELAAAIAARKGFPELAQLLAAAQASAAAPAGEAAHGGAAIDVEATGAATPAVPAAAPPAAPEQAAPAPTPAEFEEFMRLTRRLPAAEAQPHRARFLKLPADQRAICALQLRDIDAAPAAAEADKAQLAREWLQLATV